MMNKTPEYLLLEKLQNFLEKENLTVALIDKDRQHPNYSLLVSIGLDEHDRERAISIVPVYQAVNETPPELRFYSIKFHVKLPITFLPTSLDQMAAMVAFVNNQAEFPGFEIDAANHELFFRYIWMGSEEGIANLNLFKALIGLILLHLDMFSPIFEEIGSGKTTFHETIKKLLNQFKS